MNEEMMNVVEEAVCDEAVLAEACPKIGFGKSMLIGTAVVGTGYVIYKGVKKVLGIIKAKKEADSEVSYEVSDDEEE